MDIPFHPISRRAALSALAAGALLLAAPAAAEHRQERDGLVINIGVVPASTLLRVDPYERAAHAAALGRGTHHLVVGVAEAATGRPLGDAKVSVDLIDPKGATQRKTLLAGNAGGVPDYSEMFRFGWSGRYRVRVNVERAGARPVRAEFSWTQPSY